MTPATDRYVVDLGRPDGLVAYRIWFVVPTSAGHRLASPYRAPTVALWPPQPSHQTACEARCGAEPPRSALLCSCGFSAVETPVRARMLSAQFDRKRHQYAQLTAIAPAAIATGRVRLHGHVLRGRPMPEELKAGSLTIEQLAIDMTAAAVADELAAAYGVPVELGLERLVERESAVETPV